jgi:hypothetical protein
MTRGAGHARRVAVPPALGGPGRPGPWRAAQGAPQHGQGRLPQGQPQFGHAAITLTSLAGERLHAPPALGGCRRAGLPGGLGEQPGQLPPQRPKAGKLGVDLGQPPAQQRLGVAARALPAIDDLEQLGDLPQPPNRILGRSDGSRPRSARLSAAAPAARSSGLRGR